MEYIDKKFEMCDCEKTISYFNNDSKYKNEYNNTHYFYDDDDKLVFNYVHFKNIDMNKLEINYKEQFKELFIENCIIKPMAISIHDKLILKNIKDEYENYDRIRYLISRCSNTIVLDNIDINKNMLSSIDNLNILKLINCNNVDHIVFQSIKEKIIMNKLKEIYINNQKFDNNSINNLDRILKIKSLINEKTL